jgi:hypothetical protein
MERKQDVTVHQPPVMLVGASLLAIRADGAQRGNFAAPHGIREQARSYPIQVTPVNGYNKITHPSLRQLVLIQCCNPPHILRGLQ